MSARVRAAVLADLDAVMAIERASFPTDAWSEAAMRETFAEGDAFVVEEDGGVLGYAAVLAPQGSGDADVLTIAVGEAHRGAGLGAALLGHLIETASTRGASRVFLEVRADNPVAQHLYETRGFRVVGRRARYYQPDGVDAIVMRLDLGARPEPSAGRDAHERR
jgi:ribosomal-protein-alanine acetyltransferase